jgi:hypothetical protein
MTQAILHHTSVIGGLSGEGDGFTWFWFPIWLRGLVA